MFKLLIGSLVGILIVLLAVEFLPMEFLQVAGILLFVLGIVLLVLFHLGLQDFQGY